MTKRYRAKLSKQAEMQRMLSHREKGLQALDSPLRKVGVNARTRLRNRRIPDISRYRKANPARLNGRCQKACRRAFIAFDGPISTAQAAEWIYPATRPH